jgi:hypothetical protein
MPTKRSGSPVEPKPTYAEWRARCAALLERQGISAGFMREKEWRKQFIQGSPPEDVVRHAEVLYHNTRPPLERKRAGDERRSAVPRRAQQQPRRDIGPLHQPANRAGGLSGGGQDVPPRT